ncbi:MAG: glycosyltransferase family 4 protein [bacterium]|nr:glycosyltransferase family 4 protein [bacterium]
MSSKRFLFVLNRYLPSQSGAEILSSQIAEKLAEKKHSVKVLTLDVLDDSGYEKRGSGQIKGEVIRNVAVRRFPVTRFPYHQRIMAFLDRTGAFRYASSGSGVFSLEMIRAIKDEVRQCDAVVAGVMPFTGVIYPALKAARENNKKFILLPLMHFGQVRNSFCLTDFEVDAIIPERFSREFFSDAAMDIYKHSNVIITQGVYEERFAKKMTESVFARVNPAVHPLPFEEKAEEKREGFRILTLGNHNYWKGIETTLNAFRMVREKAPDAELKIIGRMESKYAKIAERMDGVFVLGSVSENEKRRSLNEADVFLLPSIAESLGIASLEAHSYGVPSIAAYCTGSMQIIKEKNNGFLVPFGDYLLTFKIIMTLYENRRILERLKSETKKIAMEGCNEIDGYRDGPFSSLRQENQIDYLLEVL